MKSRDEVPVIGVLNFFSNIFIYIYKIPVNPFDIMHERLTVASGT